ncbi:YncE family protein [Ningiella sp. W23]|uniref:YncE family protein n=1 Tax=Ningiella sp. W23 TaxID=3023715 RepID=UPI003756B6BF
MKHHLISLISIFLFIVLSADADGRQLDNIGQGLLAVVNKSDNSISVVDIKSQKIVETLPTGEGPHELVLSPDGELAVSTDFVGGDSLTVFDMNELAMLRRIELTTLPGPHGIQFLKDSEHVIFTSGRSGQVGIVNVRSGKLISSIKTSQFTSHMLALTENGQLAFVTNIRSNSISVLDIQKRVKLKDIKTEEMPEAIAHRHASKQLDRDAVGELWYGANKDGLLTVINPMTEEVLAQFDGFSFPYRILFNHEQSVALVPDFRQHNVRFFDARAKKEIGLIALEKEAGPQGIVLHPTKDIAFLSLNLKNKIVAIDINTQSIIAEYPTGNNPDGVVFISLSQ